MLPVGDMLPVKTDPKRSTSHWGSSRHSKTMLEDSESPGGARDVVCVCVCPDTAW